MMMTRVRVLTLQALLAALTLPLFTSCQKGPAPAAASVEAATAPSTSPIELRGDGLIATVTFAPPAPKVGEMFSATTTLRDEAGATLTATAFALDATMPSHGHGMMTQPTHSVQATGWRSEGMKLHMHGPWELSVEATVAGKPLKAKVTWQQAPEAL